jgi:hypothetical protein
MTTLQDCAVLLLAAVLGSACSNDDAFTAVGAAGAPGQSAGPGGTQLTECAPLADQQQSISLGAVIAVGQAADGTVVVIDRVDNTTRVFVSAGGDLVRVRVLGSSESTDSGAESALMTFEAPAGGSWTAGTETRGGTTRMALVRNGQYRTFAEVVDAGEELTVLDESAVDGFTLVNLPGQVVVEYFARTESGETIVVTRPRDDWTYEDFRVFYGTDVLLEREVSDVVRLRDGGTTTITFDLNGTDATAHFPASLDGTPDPPTLTVDDAVLALTEIDSEAELETLAFECL